MEGENHNVDENVGDFTDEGNTDPEELEELKRIADGHTPAMIEVDTTEPFLTDMEFENAEIVVEYAKKCGRKNGVVVVVKRSDINNNKRTPRIMLGCERSGGYRGKSTARKRRSSTKKCGCPFSLKARVTNTLTGRWGLIVLNGKHNHALVKTSYVGRLTKEEREIIERLSNKGVRTRDILNQLKTEDPTNAMTLKTIYNMRTAMRIKETADKSHMQQLSKLLIENGYVVRHRCETSTEVVKDLFFSSNTSIQLARAFPFVFMLDCSYKTNKYCLPLLQIVGVTSTMKTFYVAFCYMSSEKEENYQWALGCFRDLFDDAVLATVFISDRELALMNALKTVFPTAKNMLCRVHITKNVLTNCIGVFRVKAEFDEFMTVFAGVMHSSTIAEYEENVSKMHQRFAEFPVALEYVEDSWLRKYKTYFVTAYVDQFLHLGNNTTTNRVEGSHSKLKKYLSTSVGGFVQSFTQIHLLLEGQMIDIKASFEESLTSVPIRFRSFMFKELANVVSTAALEKIETELKSLPNEGMNAGICTHRALMSLGLPCAHMLAQYKDEGRSIPLRDVHDFWKKMCITPFTEAPKDELTIDMEIDILRSTFAAATIPQKLEIKRRLQCIGQANSTSSLEPKIKG